MEILERIAASVCIGQECFVAFKIPIVCLVVVAAVVVLVMARWCICSNVDKLKYSSSYFDTNYTDAFVFHDDINKLLKETGVEVDVTSSTKTETVHLPISSRLDASVALACLNQVREMKRQLKEVEASKEQEIATLRASVQEAVVNLEAEYGRALDAERTSNTHLQAQIAELTTRCKEYDNKSAQLVKLQAKFDTKKKLADELKRKVFVYEKKLLQMGSLETLQTDLSEYLEECKGMTDSAVDLSETNRELAIQVERIVEKLQNEAGRIHGVAITPEGQIRGKIVKNDNTSISMITSMSSASSAITPTQEKEPINTGTRALVTPKRLFRRRASHGSAKSKDKLHASATPATP